jgi:hypothetical protein
MTYKAPAPHQLYLFTESVAWWKNEHRYTQSYSGMANAGKHLYIY